MSIKSNYTQKELFVKGTDVYKNYLIEQINKNLEDLNNIKIINDGGKIILDIDFEKKINIEINGHTVLLQIDFLHYGPHLKDDRRFNKRKNNIKLAFNIIKDINILKNHDFHIIDLSHNEKAKIYITKNIYDIENSKTKWHNFLFFPNIKNIEKISNNNEILKQKLLNNDSFEDFLKNNIVDNNIIDNNTVDNNIININTVDNNTIYNNTVDNNTVDNKKLKIILKKSDIDVKKSDIDVKKSDINVKKSDINVKKSDIVIKKSNIIIEKNILIKNINKILDENKKLKSIIFFNTDIPNTIFEEAVQYCIDKNIILKKIEKNKYILNYSLENIENNFKIPENLLNVYKMFNKNNNIFNQYNSINIIISNNEIEIFLDDKKEKDITFFEWKINNFGCSFIINDEKILTKKISIKNYNKSVFDIALTFNNKNNNLIYIDDIDNPPILNSIYYFQYTYTGKNSIFIVNNEKNNDNIYAKGYFDI